MVTFGRRWRIEPHDVRDAQRLLDELRRYYEGELAGELEAAILARSDPAQVQLRPSVIVRLSSALAPALHRDRVAGPLLAMRIDDTNSVVDEADMEQLMRRFGELGLDPTALTERMDPSPEGSETPTTG